MQLKRIEIYLSECMGNLTPKNSKFRIDVVIGSRQKGFEGTVSQVLDELIALEEEFGVEIPEPDFKAIVGNDDDGGTMYKWNNV